MRNFTTSSLRLLAFSALLALPLVGCENKSGEARNDAEQKLETASTKIQNFAAGGAYPTPMTDEQTQSLSNLSSEVNSGNKPDWMTDEQVTQLSKAGGSNYQPLDDAKSKLGDIQKSLSSGGQGLPEQQAAQAALRAETGLAQAQLLLEGANRTDASLQQQISLASAHIDAVLDLQSIIKATESYDPSAPLREIDSQAQDARTRLAKYQSDVADIQKQITDLQSRIDAEVAQTNQLGEQAAKQREAALNAPMDVRISKIEAAAAVARQADSHQVAASKLEAQVDVLKPDLARAQMFVMEAEGELKDLDAARARIKAREKEVAAERTQLQSDLRKATEAFNAVYTPLAERFENELMPQFEAAHQAAEGALSDARASSARGGSARVSKVQQAVGQVLWREAMSIESFAQLVRRIAENGQALGRNGQDASTADALDARAKEAREGAEAAFKEALDAIPASGRTEEETAGNQQLASLIRQNIEYISGKAVAEVRDLADLPEAPPATAEPVETGESPVGVLKNAKAMLESGRLGELASLYYAKTPEEQASLDMMRKVLGAIESLDTAARSKFGVSLIDIVSDPRFTQQLQALTGGGGQSLPLDSSALAEFDKLKNVDLDSIAFTYDNSRTTAWTDTEPTLAGKNFVLVDGTWYFEATPMPEGADEIMAGMFIDPIVETVQDIATRTNNGEFPDQWVMVGAFINEFTQKMQDVMQKMMPQGLDQGGVGRQRNRGDGN